MFPQGSRELQTVLSNVLEDASIGAASGLVRRATKPATGCERIRRPAAHGHAVCTQCQVRVPVEWRPVRLCAACGVPRPEGEAGRDPCTVCAAAGWAWADGHHLCPFCTLMGVIKLDPAPRRGKGAKRQG